jgi:hypothetical protein
MWPGTLRTHSAVRENGRSDDVRHDLRT